jgi:tRNA (cytidine56-2'-O)-methyltransferase
MTIRVIALDEHPIHVVRLGYRLGRDPRITTHLGLVSRAWGAQYFHVFGDEDSKLFTTIQQVNQRFGGSMECQHQKGLLRWMRNFQDPEQTNGVIVHLTMYGQDYKEVVSDIDTNRPIAIVVGGAKVPGEVFKISNFNASVGTQPHSEVAALALFLEALNSARNTVPKFANPELIIEPSADGKIVHSMKDFEEE